MKRCPKCKRSKREGLFYNNRSQADGRSTWCKSCDKKAHWSSYNPEQRRKKLLKRYGLTLQQYDSLLISQLGLCAICQERPAITVDHDHVTGAVRGLLCHFCNRGLGFLGDTLENIEAAREYLCRKQ